MSGGVLPLRATVSGADPPPWEKLLTGFEEFKTSNNNLRAALQGMQKRQDEFERLLQETIRRLGAIEGGAAASSAGSVGGSPPDAWAPAAAARHSSASPADRQLRRKLEGAFVDGTASARASNVGDRPLRHDRIHLVGFLEPVFKGLLEADLGPQLVKIGTPEYELLVKNGSKSATFVFPDEGACRAAMLRLTKHGLNLDVPASPFGPAEVVKLGFKFNRPQAMRDMGKRLAPLYQAIQACCCREDTSEAAVLVFRLQTELALGELRLVHIASKCIRGVAKVGADKRQ